MTRGGFGNTSFWVAVCDATPAVPSTAAYLIDTAIDAVLRSAQRLDVRRNAAAVGSD